MNDYSVNSTPGKVLIILAKRLKQLRKSKKISQTDLADRSGVSLGSLKRFEQSGQISLESLLKLVNVLGRLNEFESLLMEQANMKNIEKLFD